MLHRAVGVGMLAAVKHEVSMRSASGWSFARVGVLAALAACGGRASERGAAGNDVPMPDGSELGDPEAVGAPESGVPDVVGLVDPAALVCSLDGVWRGSVRVTEQADLEQLRGCARISGDLTIELFDGLEAAPLESLRVVEGLVSVLGPTRRQPALLLDRPLDVLRSLERAGGLKLLRVPAPNLEGLAKLQSLEGISTLEMSSPQLGLWIEACPGLVSLTGLESLVRVGPIRLAGNRQLASLRGLEGLGEAESLTIFDAPELRDLQGLAATSLRALEIDSTGLESLAGLGNAARLERLALLSNLELTELNGAVFGDTLTAVTLDDNRALRSVSGLASLRQLSALTIGHSPLLLTLEGLEQLERVGQLYLHGLGLLSLRGLEGLVAAESISLQGNLQLVELTGLSSLREALSLSVGNSPALLRASGLGGASVAELTLSSLALTDLTGLEQVRIESTLTVYGLPSLTSLTGLPSLAEGANLELTLLGALADTSALAQQSALGWLSVTGTGLGVLSGLAELERLGGLSVYDNQQLTQIEGSPRLRELGGVQIAGNSLLRSLPAWNEVQGTLASCNGCALFSLEIRSNEALESGPVLPVLQSAGQVLIANNPSLRELSGLSALRSVESLRVVNNVSLASVELPELQQAGGLDIHGNSALEEALVFPLRQQLGSSGTIQILSNSSGPALMDPCPWSSDGSCDEASGACAPRTDSDCPFR
ncbi:MAG: hypothetical protein RL685_350 [Pseudomonadota bacterium]|jgi:hypothetical protein